jgi:hypothetical protein
MTNSSLADGYAAENVRCPVSRRALVAGLAGALGGRLGTVPCICLLSRYN